MVAPTTWLSVLSFFLCFTVFVATISAPVGCDVKRSLRRGSLRQSACRAGLLPLLAAALLQERQIDLVLHHLGQAGGERLGGAGLGRVGVERQQGAVVGVLAAALAV